MVSLQYSKVEWKATKKTTHQGSAGLEKYVTKTDGSFQTSEFQHKIENFSYKCKFNKVIMYLQTPEFCMKRQNIKKQNSTTETQSKMAIENHDNAQHQYTDTGIKHHLWMVIYAAN